MRLFRSIRRFFSITAVRLTILFTLLFGITAVGLVFYVSAGAVRLLREEITQSINAEIEGLQAQYNQEGLGGVVRTMRLRSHAPDANLYVLTDPSGVIVAGNVLDFIRPEFSRGGWSETSFRYSRFHTSDQQALRAVARRAQLPNGMSLIIGRDIGQPEKFRDLIINTLALALGSMVVLGFLAWYFIGRRALKRIDLVAKSTDRILSGDRSERLPIVGSGDEFDRLSQGLNTMLDRINRLDEGLRQVSDNIAHDLKTPLTRIRNSLEKGLEQGKNLEDKNQALQDTIAEADNLIKTFDALLMISRVESGSTAAQLQVQNLTQILQDIVELYEPVAEEENFILNSDIQPDLQVSGNRELLSQALSNLVDNALKYGAANSGQNAIKITGKSLPHGGVQIVVSDHGPGIPHNARKKVLQRFHRLEKSRSKPGSGLGLSLVKAVTSLHNGELDLDDNHPGLRVSITFPPSQQRSSKNTPA